MHIDAAASLGAEEAHVGDRNTRYEENWFPRDTNRRPLKEGAGGGGETNIGSFSTGMSLYLSISAGQPISWQCAAENMV
jgi:hypothetical protein